MRIPTARRAALSTLKIFSLLLAVLALQGCKVQIETTSNGLVKSMDGSYECVRDSQCTVEVNDIFFDQTYIAVPADGYEFVRWQRIDRGLCGGHKSTCPLSTKIFAGYEVLIALLESDETFYLAPKFRKKGDVDNSELTGTWIFSSEASYTSSSPRGVSQAEEQIRFSVTFEKNMDGELEAFDCRDDGVSRRRVEIVGGGFTLGFNRDSAVMKVVDNNRLEGFYRSDRSGFTFQKSTITAVKIDDHVTSSPSYSLGIARIDIVTSKVERHAEMPIGCYAKSEKEGRFEGQPYVSDYLIFFAFDNLSGDGPSHRAELGKRLTGDSVSASFSDRGHQPVISPFSTASNRMLRSNILLRMPVSGMSGRGASARTVTTIPASTATVASILNTHFINCPRLV